MLSPSERRIGILGGTFDPVHVAHLRVAEEAREALALDRILFVPAATPPHKSGHRISPAADRLAMLRLAVAGNPRFRVSPMEIERRGRSYSIDTLRTLRAQLPAATRITFLVGLDQFREIGTWKEYGDLFALADFAVLSRPSYRLTSPRALLPVAVRSDFCYQSDRRTLLHESGNRVLFLNVTALEISATDIRRRASQGQSIRYLVPGGVERYVRERALYARGSTGS